MRVERVLPRARSSLAHLTRILYPASTAILLGRDSREAMEGRHRTDMEQKRGEAKPNVHHARNDGKDWDLGPECSTLPGEEETAFI